MSTPTFVSALAAATWLDRFLVHANFAPCIRVNGEPIEPKISYAVIVEDIEMDIKTITKTVAAAFIIPLAAGLVVGGVIDIFAWALVAKTAGIVTALVVAGQQNLIHDGLDKVWA